MAEASAAVLAGSSPSQLPADRPGGASGRSAADRRAELVRLYRQVGDCRRCPLAETRTNVVFGSGDADADLMLVGEAPGFHEDRQARPFVGRAGKLLDELLLEIGLGRGDVFVANILKCRPPGNRDPEPGEIEECRPYLMQQLELIEPRVVCTLGNFATRLLTGSRQGITRARGQVQERELAGRSVQLYPIFHPAAALRSDDVRRQLREDFRRLPELLAERRPQAAAPYPAGTREEQAGAAAAPAGGEPGSAAPPPQLGLFG